MNINDTIKAIVILQIDGRRTIAKYNDQKINTRQFERQLFSKTKTPKAKDEVLVLEGVLVVHRFVIDSHIYIVGSINENPLILDSILNCIVGVVSKLSSDKQINNTVLDNLSKIIAAIDEICEEGLLLEVDPNLVVERINTNKKSDDSGESMVQGARRLFGL